MREKRREERSIAAPYDISYNTDLPSGNLRLVVPSSLRSQLLNEHYDAHLAAHLGTNKTYTYLRRLNYWPNMLSSVVAYCRSCDICHVSSPRIRPLLGSYILSRLQNAAGLLQSMDFVTRLPKTKAGHNHLRCCRLPFQNGTFHPCFCKPYCLGCCCPVLQ